MKFLFFFFLFSQALAQTVTPDRIFHGGSVITLNDAGYIGEAIAIADGKVLRVGTNQEIMKLKSKNTQMHDLQGKSLLPGLIDAHGHMGAHLSFWKKPNLAPPPAGPVSQISDIIKIMQEEIAKNRPSENALVLGMNYDDSLLKEKRHPTRQEVDLISATHLVCLLHVSGHLATCNTKALNKAGYKKGTPNPAGGVIQKDKNGEPTGVLEEQAVYPVLAFLPKKTQEETEKDFYEIQQHYAENGITTAQDGLSSRASIKLFSGIAKKQKPLIDIVIYPGWGEFDGATPYQNGIKVAGVKITMDGSPQGKTAFLSRPYLKVTEGEKEDYRGYSIMPQKEIDEKILRLFKDNVQVNLHCNGDACIDMVLQSLTKAQQKYPKKNLRPVMIHSQTVRTDQLEKMKHLKIFPSFFPAHTFFWGDWYRQETLGVERASRISPLKEAESFGIKYSIHNDAPVIPVNLIYTLWASVNRLTRSNYVLGPEQRISTLNALKAMTSWAAYQIFEEESKGTLEPGKVADLVILSQNPLEMENVDLLKLKVEETIKDGQTIYKSK